MAISKISIATWILGSALGVALPLQALAGTDYSLCTGLLDSAQGPRSRGQFIPYMRFQPGGGMVLDRSEGWRKIGAARLPTTLSEKYPGTDRYKVLDYVFNDVPGITTLQRADGSTYSLYNFARVRFHFDEQGRLEKVTEEIRVDAGYETGRQVRSQLSLDREAALRDRRKPQEPIDLTERIEGNVKRREWSFRYVGDRCVPDSERVELLDNWGDPRRGEKGPRQLASSSWCAPLKAFFAENPNMLECLADLMIEDRNGASRPAAEPPQCRNTVQLQRLSSILPGAAPAPEGFGIATTAARAEKRWCEHPAVSRGLPLLAPAKKPVARVVTTEDFAAIDPGD